MTTTAAVASVVNLWFVIDVSPVWRTASDAAPFFTNASADQKLALARENVRRCLAPTNTSAADQLVDRGEIIGEDRGTVEVGGQGTAGQQLPHHPLGIGIHVARLAVGGQPCCE